MDTETIILQLPESLYRTARRIAETTGQSVPAVLQASIAHALPPLDDVPEDEAVQLANLALLDDGALWRVARATMTVDEQTEMVELLDRQGSGQFTAAERARLQDLQDRYGRLMVRKAHAFLLLARRGYRVPMQDPPS